MANDKLAVLIDADNAQAACLPELLSEVARYGTATVKRAYGDWTTQNLKAWKETLHKHAVQPIQQFRYTQGKNATDSALIIDAMDLLYAGHLHGFCLVSSDSDFTRLATRLRESGAAVYGFGEKKTPEPFVAACDKFIYTEILRPEAIAVGTQQPLAAGGSEITTVAPATPILDPAKALQVSLNQAIESSAKEDGWAAMGAVGAMMQKIDPAFDARNFGYSKFGALVRAQPFAEVKEVPTGDGSTSALYVRLR
ncbi:MAG TPA: NYN domain-containing protein [Rhodocyclaceae bacterium]|nr:NYN domain-containing protein [Rhodocyclaceae bacterium]